MKISANTLVLVVCSTLAATGCKCDGGQTELTPDYFPTPAAISFEACPTRDESGAAVNDVFPDTQKVTIENRGRGGSSLKVSLDGGAAGMFSLGTVPERLEALASIELPITFTPTRKGDLKADLLIEDGDATTPDQTVTLVGTGKNLPSTATIETAPQKTDKSGYLLCQEGSPLSDCTVAFPDTLFNQATTLELKIRNKGCPSLKVTDLFIESARGDTQGFSIDAPVQLPSATSPLTLSTADGTDEYTVVIRFSPTDDGSGNNTRDASLVILSNDKINGDGFAQPARLSLSGRAIKPAVYTTPSFCDYSKAEDLCGFDPAPNPHDKARFRITNDGNVGVQLTKVSFRSTGGTTGVGGRFTITTNVQGQTIIPTASTVLEVSHSDMPLYVSDQIDIESTIVGQAAGSGGTVTVAVYGGKKPHLSTSPGEQMNFNNPATEFSAQPFRVENGLDAGVLVINSVTIEPASPFFTVIEPLITRGTQVNPGEYAETTIQYRRPPSGGMQIATLYIRTNDSDYGPPGYKQVQLLSSSPLDELPTAVLTACNPAILLSDPDCRTGAQQGFSANYAMLTRKEIALSGVLSTDAAPGTVNQYRFTLLPPFPGNVNSTALVGHNTKSTSFKTKLNLPPAGVGVYRVMLEVFDDRGQKSANSPIVNVNIYP